MSWQEDFAPCARMAAVNRLTPGRKRSAKIPGSAGEPAATKREGLGVWVILFLAFFTMMAWLLKKEYWRDVH